MRVWIDATSQNERIEIFGMTLLERLLRSLLETQRQVAGLKSVEEQLQGLTEARAYLASFVKTHLVPTEVRIELAGDAPIPDGIPRELLEQLPIRWSRSDAPLRERLQAALEDSRGEPVIALSSETLIDVRLLEHLIFGEQPIAFLGGTGSEEGAALRLDQPLPSEIAALQVAEDDLLRIGEQCVERGLAKPFDENEFEGYIPKLRRTQAAYLFRIRRASTAGRVERFLFRSNYKGATDFLTKYVYPPLVWRIVKPLAARRVRPNVVTTIGIVCCFAAIPLFAAAWWIPGLLLGYVMSVLDSVDGKLARVTFSSSKQGDVLDHGTDYVHPPLWYFAWAWGLSGGDPFSPVFQASLWMAGLYILDRVLETLFKSCTGGRSVQDYTPLDAKLRTFVSRRNINMALFTVALPFGLGVESVFAILALQAATCLYHLVRVIQCWNEGDTSSQRELQVA